MESLFLHYITEWPTVAYGAVFLSMLFEGETLLFTTFYLAHQGYFSLPIIIIMAITGVLIGDTLWYKFGWYLEEKIPWVKKWLTPLSRHLDAYLAKHPWRTIFIAKFSYGFHHAVLLRAGAVKINFKRFLELDIISSLCWIALIGGLGYLSSSSAVILKQYLKYTEVGLFLGILLMIIVSHIIARRLKL